MFSKSIHRATLLALLTLLAACITLPSIAEQAQPILEIPLEESDVQRYPAHDASRLGRTAAPAIEKAADDEDDPAALLDDQTAPSMKALAQRLSADRTWLRAEILSTLAVQDLHLDEIFVEAPELVAIGASIYRIQVEQAGSGWADFDPGVDPFFVFLNLEIYEGFGSDRALAYAAGEETVIFAYDLETTPAISLSLIDVPNHEALHGTETIASIHNEIRLGASELRLPIERLPIHLYQNLHAIAVAGERFSLDQLRAARDLAEAKALTGESTSGCTQEVASTSCSGGRPVCAAGYAPYFVVSNIKIKEDHEGALKGNPEIELFPLRVDVASPLGSNTTATTNFWFYGQNVTDMAGRTRYLPDVNDINVWYTVTNGVALFPLDKGYEFSALLVEQDDDRGVLRVKSTKINVTKLFKRVGTVVSYILDARVIDANFLVQLGKIILDIIGLFNDGDDLFQESIGFANSLLCTDSLGQMKTYTFTSQEWEMKGRFSCINPSCPDPGTGGGGGGGGLPGGGCFTGIGDTLIPADCQ